MSNDIPAIPMVRTVADEVRDVSDLAPTAPPPPGGSADARLRGGWDPKAASSEWHGPPISRGEDSPDPLTPVMREGFQEAEAREAESRAMSEIEVATTWSGAPTKGTLRRLRLEGRTPVFDAATAEQVLDLMAEGQSLTKACVALGVRRGVVLAWRKLVPEFDEWVSEFETWLGSYHRDVAADEVGSDPGVAAARLKLAAAYDRRILKGEGEGGSVAVVVNVQR